MGQDWFGLGSSGAGMEPENSPSWLVDAILLLLARLGLRSGDAYHLTLDDIDWENSRIDVRGKGDRVVKLPLPTEVGKAIAA